MVFFFVCLYRWMVGRGYDSWGTRKRLLKGYARETFALLEQQPALLEQQPALLEQQPALLEQQPALLEQQPAPTSEQQPAHLNSNHFT
ncbi:hypothetical protein AVEN_202099-1 [Araneus ventricosus]|uniref:Uncharacterized protein n=1 Tax=Araneus ventricosus TaxID=182803 RepID=A0A4Y2PTC7_ARAVE|nr:hypothetical protein AVEN_202099-1 [Araneus ventricosus]